VFVVYVIVVVADNQTNTMNLSTHTRTHEATESFLIAPLYLFWCRFPCLLAYFTAPRWFR